jgi:hypothetical protein
VVVASNAPHPFSKLKTYHSVQMEASRLFSRSSPGVQGPNPRWSSILRIAAVTTKYFRKLGGSFEAFSMWLTLLLNGDYGAGICGKLSRLTVR